MADSQLAANKAPSIKEAENKPPRKRKGLIKPAVVGLAKFVQWFVLLPVTVLSKKGQSAEEVTVYSAHPSFYLWLLILTGFIGSWIVHEWPASAGVMGW